MPCCVCTDPVLTQVGPGVPAKGEFPGDLLDPGHSGTVVALGSLVENLGRVVGWELSVKTAGTFKVLVSVCMQLAMHAWCVLYTHKVHETQWAASRARAHARAHTHLQIYARARTHLLTHARTHID